MELADRIQRLFEESPPEFTAEHYELFDEFKTSLNRGEVRAAERVEGRWRVNLWVKRGILLGFRMGRIENFSINDEFRFFDKHTYPLKHVTIDDAVRIVPGGSSIRDGCYIGRGVTCMPPMFVNAGAYVDDNTMIDSHALVGSCAQVGKRVHISAAAQIGGVLEPIGEMPVIIEDDVLIGGNCGVYEGAIVRERAVLAAGTILTGGTPVYDLVRDEFYRKTPDAPLEIPAGAVVVPGSRAVTRGRGKEIGLSVYMPVIVKYRDEKTDASVRLEDILR
ncbi:MAG TPA: 2,3,4,5-tetrahydropyridine-2,6-dicarboxylate N-succinyltransferase [Blastocatellia bacterium]|nr:2,3,4,5-tetrahydropyridine-2,6-dicarboxylate N-succinyltransferase [Blastocatellia bacterium]